MGRAMRNVFLAAAVLFSACASGQTYEQIHAAAFRDYGDTPLDHTVYEGSDGGFHYFVWEHGKSSGRWKVSKEEMPFKVEWPLGSREAFMVKDASGKWQPYNGGS